MMPLHPVAVLKAMSAAAILCSVSPSPEDRALQGMACFREGRFLKAERAWKLALRSQPAFLKEKILGYLRTGRTNEALFAAKRLHELADNDPESLFLVGKTYLASGATDRGRALVAKALSLDPSLIRARLVLAGLAVDRKQLDKAEELLDYPLPPTAAAGTLRGRLALAAGNPAKAVSLLEEAARLDPSNTSTLLYLARAYTASGHADKALSIIDKALSLLPGDETFRLEKAEALLASENSSSVQENLRELLHSTNTYVADRAGTLLISLLTRDGSFEEALKLCLKAIKNLSPDDSAGRRLLLVRASNLFMKVATLREQRGARQKADLAFARSIEYLQDALAADTANEATKSLLTERYIELGEHYFNKGKQATSSRTKSELYGYAIFNIERAVELESKSENRAHRLLGKVFNHLQRHEEALAHFKKIKSELCNFVESIYSYGESCLKLRNLHEASRAFRRVLQIHPGHWKAQRDLGLTFWYLKALGKAAGCFEKSASLNDRDITTQLYLGKIRMRRKKYGQARECFLKVLSLTMKTRSKPLLKMRLEAKALLQELAPQQAADRKLKSLGGKPREEELSRRLYGR